MAKQQNQEIIEEVKKGYSQGLSDGKIAKEYNRRVNVVHYYRHFVLKLPAHQTKRVYTNQDDKLKGYIIRGIKSSAKRRRLDFDLQYQDLELPSRCPLLGLELSYKNFSGTSQSNERNFATVDRKDNSKGYVKGNVWIISRMANSMKSSASLEELKLFANNILYKNMI